MNSSSFFKLLIFILNIDSLAIIYQNIKIYFHLIKKKKYFSFQKKEIPRHMNGFTVNRLCPLLKLHWTLVSMMKIN